MLASTPFYLQTKKPPTHPNDLTSAELQDLLMTKLSDQKDFTPEEAALIDALYESLSKESCKEAAGTSKRPRRDDEPDPNSKSKKQKSGKGPTSTQKEPATTIPASQPQQQPHGSESAPQD